MFLLLPFSNVKALWNEVHITSVLTPCEVYPSVNRASNDRIEQLLRRITSICYHYKSVYDTYEKAYFKSNSLRIDMENQVNVLKQFVTIDSEEVVL